MKYYLLFIIFFSWSSGEPKLNQKIIEYIDTVIGQQVDRGECWDLAAAALDYAGAYLDRSNQKNIYVFGKIINPKKDRVYRGDIIQLENIKLEYQIRNTIHTETMNHHTAIVYEVLGKNHYKVAHQNTNFSGRKVGVSELNLNSNIHGNITVYRPYKK